LRELDENRIAYRTDSLADHFFKWAFSCDMFLDNGYITVLLHRDNDETERYAKYISGDGYWFIYPEYEIIDGVEINMGGGNDYVEWETEPHFFKKDRVIVVYDGNDENILKFLYDEYGPEFAGNVYIGD